MKGIERVPEFVQRAQNIARRFDVEGVSFECQDMRHVDFKDATFVFLYGTCLNESSIEQLKIAFQHLPQGTKIVTVSYPINGLKQKDQFTVAFPWGEEEIFLQEPLLIR